MASVKLNGDTSGFIEISAPNVAGSTTITLPATSGGNFLVTDSNGDLNVDSGTLFVDASTNRVGVGTTSPASILHLSGSSDQICTLQTETSGADNRINFRNSGGTDAGGIWYKHNGNHLAFNTGGSNSESARIDGSGRLLVNETSSTQAGSIDAKAQVVSSDFNAALTVRRNQASDGAPGVLFCKSRGTSNSANVIVQTGDGLGNIRFFGADGTGGNDFAEGGAISCVVDATPGADDMPGRLEFKTTANGESSPTTQMRLANNGRLTVGTTVANNGHFMTNSGNDTSTLRLRQVNNGAGVLSLYYVGASNLNANDRYLSCIPSDGGGGARCFINSNGGIQNYQSNDSNLCDEREKKNIVDLGSTWNCLKHWELKKFHYNEDADTDDKRYGVIAQQVAPHCPEVISEWTKVVGKEAVLDEDGNEVEPAVEEVLRMGVKEQQMMWMAVKALQEAQTRIEQLETTNASLEARLTALEGGN